MPVTVAMSWANVKLGAIVRRGEVWATVLALHPHIYDRAETGVDLWISGAVGRGKILSVEVMPADLVSVLR